MTGPLIRSRTYVITAAALLVLLGLTVVAGCLPLGSAKPFVTLLIAAVKAGLVATIFMHLRVDRPVTRLFAVAGLAWLAILIGLTLIDVLTRTSS